MKYSMIKSLINNHFVVFAGWDQLMQAAARDIGLEHFQQLHYDGCNLGWTRTAGSIFLLTCVYRLHPDYYIPTPPPEEMNRIPYCDLSAESRARMLKIGIKNYQYLARNVLGFEFGWIKARSKVFVPTLIYRINPDYVSSSEPTPLTKLAQLLMSARSDLVVHGNYAAASATISTALDLVAEMEGGA